MRRGSRARDPRPPTRASRRGPQSRESERFGSSWVFLVWTRKAARWGSNHGAPSRQPLGGQGRISSGTARRTVPPFVSRLTVLVESGPGVGLVMRIDQDESDWTLALPRKVPVSVVPMRARTRGDPWVEPVSVPVMRQPRVREYWARFTLSRSPAGGGVMTPPERAVGRATVGT